VDCFRTIYKEAVEYTDAQIHVPGRPWWSRGVHLTFTMHVTVTVPNVLVLQKHFGTPCDVSLLRPSHVGCYSCRSAGSLFPDGIPILLWRLHSFVVSSRLLMCEFLTFPWKRLVFPGALAAWSVRRSWLSVETWLTYNGVRGWRLCQSCSWFPWHHLLSGRAL
jgi:hypothetical protein